MIALDLDSKFLSLIKPVFIITCVLLVYSNIRFLEFQMHWDDQWVVINDYTEGGVNWDNISAIFTDYYHGQYAPINELYYLLIYSLFGYDPLYFHLGSLLVHCVNCILVFFLINQIAKDGLRLKKFKSEMLAFITAIAFGVHPANLEAVAWISASKILIYSFFYLAALVIYTRYIQSGNHMLYYFILIFFILSFLSKEQAVTFPITLLLIDYIFKGDIFNKQVLIEKVPFFLLSILFGIITISSQITWTNDTIKYAPIERFFLIPYTLCEYITKSVIPVNLLYIYPFPFQPGQKIPQWLYIFPMILIPFFATLPRKRWIIFGFGFFLINIVLVLNIINLPRFSLTADRYMYLSTIGISFIIAYMIYGFINYSKLRRIILVIYLCALSFYTMNHLMVWKNSKSLKNKLIIDIKKK